MRHITKSNSTRVSFVQRVITFVNALCCKSLYQKETFYRLHQNAASCSTDSQRYFSYCKQIGFESGRVRHSNSDYNPNRSLHLASAYNSGCRYCDKLQKTRMKGW